MASTQSATCSLEGKVPVVIGSGRGIGKEVALEPARRKAKVAISYANSSKGADEVVQQIKDMRSSADAVAIKADVTNIKDTEKLMDEVIKSFGKLDICGSNSGVVSSNYFKNVTEEEYDRIMDVNTRGSISIAGQAKGIPKHAVCSGSKGAVEAFARCMAVDAGGKKVTVNCLAPGGIKTDMYYANISQEVASAATIKATSALAPGRLTIAWARTVRSLTLMAPRACKSCRYVVTLSRRNSTLPLAL